MQQLMANLRVMTTMMSTSPLGEAATTQDEDGFVESASRKIKTGNKSSPQNAMVLYSSQPKLTAKEQEESAKRARSRISSSPESKLQHEQWSNRYELLSADPDNEKVNETSH